MTTLRLRAPEQSSDSISAPELGTIADYVDHHARRTPAADATWYDGHLTDYATLDEQVDRFGRALMAAGVRAGDRVAVLSTPRPEFLVSLLGAMRIGAVWVGLNPKYTHRELAHVVKDSEPTLIFSLAHFEGRDFAPDIERLMAESPSVRAAYRLDAGPGVGPLTASSQFLAQAELVRDAQYVDATRAVHTSDAAVIVYTSGTSGQPKGAVLANEGLVYAFRTEARVVGVAQPRVPCNLPVNHIACIGDVCATTLIAGGMIAFLERFDPAELLARVEELRLTTLLHVPTVLQLVSAQPDFGSRDLSSLRAVVWGGAPLPIEVMHAYRSLGVRMMTVYGMTETSASMTWTDADADDETLATTVGRPDPDMEIRLVTDSGADAETGEQGEVWVRHRCLMKGYFRRPEATASAFTPDGFFRTGDVALRRADGNLRLVGRRTEMYKSGGYNVYPREIELCLEEHPDVEMAAVVGVPDPVYSEVGAAFVTTTSAETGRALDRESLRGWCRERLANYKIPKRFEVLDELPLLPVGKVDKQSLRMHTPGTKIQEN